MTTKSDSDRTRWVVNRERLVDDSRLARLSVASVRLPDGVEFEQYVLRMPRAAMAVATDDRDRVLMIWRHRFVMDRWTWEIPGGYVDDDEEPADAARRELREETGYHAGSLRLLTRFQPLEGTADFENYLYLAEDLSASATPIDVNESERVEWIPLASVPELVERGEIIGAGTQLGLLHAALLRGKPRSGS